MSDEFPEVPEISDELIQSVVQRVPAIPGIDSIMGALMMAIMPLVMGGTTCECDMCQTLTGIFAGFGA